ncbi:hypothetical protein ACN94_20905 [Gordonia paraffinivorans]|uniref:sugar ABC transporter ATP-binding protein n=1 Tax=Gordonia paraffinivorans TaxID=175628 RepID=UPI001C92E662|nr:sugar ABC transporter ATP-binding protein [Gordonia paraffinivorans]MBY4576008.1 hypothetical protein [Gordonia paraffinivorans]
MGDNTVPLVSVRSVSKTFPGQKALDEMSIDLRSGEVHALLGQNGSGKSTLIKVLTGYYQADDGAEVEVRGRPGHFTRQGPASDDGEHITIRAVHQHLGLVGGLSVMDNVALITGYRTRGWGAIDWRAQERFTRELLARAGLEEIDVHTTVDDITPLERTQVAIARAMAGWDRDSDGILILDEPTATLPAEQSENLFQVVRDLRARGVGIIYVSHRLDEIVELADVVTVLRDGRRVSTSSMAGVGHAQLVDLMLGTAQAAVTRTSTSRDRVHEKNTGEVVVEVSGFSGGTVRELDFEVRAGEVLGFAGLVGSGCEDLPYLLAGAKKAESGRLRVRTDIVEAKGLTPRRAAELGLGLVPADRGREAVVPQFDIAQNISLPRLGEFQRTGWLREGQERSEAQQWVDRMTLVPGDVRMAVTDLSGGNQQKAILARWLAVARNLLILAEPTAGVDIGAKALIYELLRAEARNGLAIVVCSTDYMDLEQICDRIIVLESGRMADSLVGQDITEDSIAHAVLLATEVVK